MCATCGCSDDAGVRINAPGAAQVIEHDHEHPHEHSPGHEHSHPHEHQHGAEQAQRARTVTLEQDVLAKNDLRAERNRGWLRGRGILAVNLMSSPGAGKTTLLERTVREFSGRELAVVEGDQETLLDAERIKTTGVPVVQINTGSGCHLDAEMLERGLGALDPAAGSVLFIENVGNLVCPALFDLGEDHRAVIMSVTEGQDKPLKYPNMFAAADLVLLNKVDLLPHLDFDVDAFLADARKVNPTIEVLRVSATTGDGLADWYTWLRER